LYNSNVTIEQAGVPKAAYMGGTAEYVLGGFLPPQSKVAYRFLFGKKDANNNLLLGSPSARHIISNIDFIKDVTYEVIDITIVDNSTIEDRHFIVIYTKDKKFTYYFNKSGAEITPPYTNLTFGSTFIEINISNSIDENNTAAILANYISNSMSEYNVTILDNSVTLTSTEEGDINSPELETGSLTPITLTVLTEGQVEKGKDANCNLTLILPSSISTEYFIQVYRTAIITAVEGVNLDDIDPGDECNIVYEKSITQENIDDGELNFQDSISESFRASGLPLYTNQITGEGILQSNDPPPIALDIELFRNSMFYANTKSSHRIQFDILSVDNFVTNSTKLIIGNSNITRYYTASDIEIPDTEEGGDFKLSTSSSVGQAIDNTSRSIVKVINQDQLSPVNAFYLTGSDDLPGKILLEARDLSDEDIYISIEELSYDETYPIDNIGGEFNPEIPISKPIKRIRGNTSTTIITMEDTGLAFSDGDTKFISFFTDGTNSNAPANFSGVYTISNVTEIGGDTEFEIDVPLLPTVDSDDGSTGFVIHASSVFTPDFKSDNLKVPNRIYYSKLSEPEAVPIANYIDVGAKDQEIKRILALRDNLFVLKDDGIYIVSGTSAPDFSVRLLDNARILAPDSAVVLNNQIFCLTEQGITVITDSGAGIISRGIENLIDKVTNSKFDYVSNTFGVSYENDRAYLLFMPQSANDNSATQAFRYHIFERTWSRWEYDANCGLVAEKDNTLYLGSGDRNYVSKERKNFDRTDHSDRDFSNEIVADGVDSTEITIASSNDIEVGDVIIQTQDISINYFNNRILRRMDTFDTGIIAPVDSTLLESFGMVNGDNLVEKLQALVDYLYTLDSSITKSEVSNNTVLDDMKLLVDELNTTETITSLKNYAYPEQVIYEAYITSVDAPNNLITINTERPFLEGSIQVYKNIKKTVEWNPQHFGDPSALKQVREVTIMFDQNNFYDAIAKFGSDVDQSLTEVPFQGKGIGYWGDMEWSNPNAYWGGEGNDIPFRTIVPRSKQRCRYITMVFEHTNAREQFRVLGVSGVIRPISSRGYK